jgi:hypothetical protein
MELIIVYFVSMKTAKVIYEIVLMK